MNKLCFHVIYQRYRERKYEKRNIRNISWYFRVRDLNSGLWHFGEATFQMAYPLPIVWKIVRKQKEREKKTTNQTFSVWLGRFVCHDSCSVILTRLGLVSIISMGSNHLGFIQSSEQMTTYIGLSINIKIKKKKKKRSKRRINVVKKVTIFQMTARIVQTTRSPRLSTYLSMPQVSLKFPQFNYVKYFKCLRGT